MGRIFAQGHLQCADPAAGLKKKHSASRNVFKKEHKITVTEELHLTNEPAFNALVNETLGLR